MTNFKLYIDHGSTKGIFLGKINKKQLAYLQTRKIDNVYISSLGRLGLLNFSKKYNIPPIRQFLRLSSQFYLYAEEEDIKK